MLQMLRLRMGIAEPRPNLGSADVMLVLFLGFLETRSREAQALATAAAAIGAAAGTDGAPPATAEHRAAAGTLAPATALMAQCNSLMAQVKTKGPPYPTWDQAYAIERELVTLQVGDRLHQTLQGLLDRADEASRRSGTSLRKRYEALLPRIMDSTAAPPSLRPGSEPLLLPLALAALETVQWEQTKTFKAVPLKRRAIHRLVEIEFLVFVFFVLPYAWTDLRAGLGNPLVMKDWSWLPLWIALSGGLLGAFFSRLWSLQNGLDAMTLDEVENAGDWPNIILRGAVGMLGSLVVFFFLQSGIVSGNLFPTFKDIVLLNPNSVTSTTETIPHHAMITVPSQALALMVIWSFIAGFSQRLVPDILAKTEAQLNAGVAPASSPATKPA